MSMKDYRKLQEQMKAEKEATRQVTSSDTTYFSPFKEMKVNDEVVIRLLPDQNQNNPYQWYVEKVSHKFMIDGKFKSVPCVYAYDKTPCPICRESQKFYKEEGKGTKTGLELYRKLDYICQVLVVDDPTSKNGDDSREGKVYLMNLSKNLLQFILAQMGTFADDDDEPWKYDGGFDFVLKKTLKDGQNNYIMGSSFKRRPRNLTEAELEVVENGLIDLSTVLPEKPAPVVLDKILAEYFGNMEDAGDSGDADYDFQKGTSVKEEPKTESSISQDARVQEILNRAKKLQNRSDDD